MSGSSASLNSSGGAGGGLPVPYIQLASALEQKLTAYNPNAAGFMVSADGTKLGFITMPIFTAKEIPEALFEKDLRLEVLWYTRKSLKAKGGSSRGYVHPTHTAGLSSESPTGGAPVAPTLPNSRFRGGQRNIFDGFVSEWSVTKNGQRFFIDGLGKFFQVQSINYINGAGVSQANVQAFVPTNVAANGGQSPNPSGFGYSARYRPNYFKFRFSIQDPSDPRARITGAETGVFVVAPAIHPFVQDVAASQAAGHTVNKINTGYDATRFNVWRETRLPSGI